MQYPVLLMETAQKISQDDKEQQGSLLTDKDKKKLAGYMQKLGFDDIATQFSELNPGSKEKVNNMFQD